MPTVFWSWQSDQPRKITRDVIEMALNSAIMELNADIVAADRDDESLLLDKDTQGIPGSPDITETILKKIDEASAFVADMTPVTTMRVSQGKTKHLQNSNVLIELGYAKKALSPLRLVQVWNTALTNCTPEDLPFDMRGRRGPIAFNLAPTADAKERKLVVNALTKRLVEALRLIVHTKSEPISRPADWAQSQSNDSSIWPNEDGEMLVNEPHHGSGIKQVFPPPRSFVRILPSRWNGSDDLDRHDLLIEMHGGSSWGATVGGVLTYPGSILYADTSKVHAITKRFETTGELWATRTDLARKYGDHLCIRGDAIPEEWLKYLAYALPHVTKGGGEWPLKVRLGVVGLSGCHWPTDGASGRPPVALKSELTTEFTLREKSVEEIWLAIFNAWRDFRKIFSMPHPSQVAQDQAKHFLTSVIGDSLK